MTWRHPSATPGTNLVDTYTNRPAAGLAWQRFTPTDGGPEFVWDGTLWRPALGTTLGYEPPSSGWTAVDGGNGANISFANGVLELASTGSNSSIRWSLAVRSIDGSSVFDLRSRMRSVYSPCNSGGGVAHFYRGICVRDSSSGNMQILSHSSNAQTGTYVVVETYSNPTTFLGTQIIHNTMGWDMGSECWFRVVNNPPTSRSYFLSNDGVRWWQIYSVSWASRYPTTVDQVGIQHCTHGNVGARDAGARLESWRVQ